MIFLDLVLLLLKGLPQHTILYLSSLSSDLGYHGVNLTELATKLDSYSNPLSLYPPFPSPGSYLYPLPGLLRLFLVFWPLSTSSKGGTARNLKQDLVIASGCVIVTKSSSSHSTVTSLF